MPWMSYSSITTIPLMKGIQGFFCVTCWASKHPRAVQPMSGSAEMLRHVTSCFRMLRKRTKKQHQGNLKNGWHKVDQWHSFSEKFGDKRLRDSNSVCGNNLRSDLNKLQHTRYPAITYVVSIQVVAVTIKMWSQRSLTETVQEETQWSLPYL